MTQDAPGTPAAEVEINEALVRALLAAQMPDLADQPLRFAGEGWDNVMMRIGDTLVARLPRRRIAEQLLKHEQKWLPELAPRLPLQIPAPLRVGRPNADYPFAWSVIAWTRGEAADLAPPHADQAPVLANFLKALHTPAPADAPTNSVRDCPLVGKQIDTERRMEILRASTHAITPEVMTAWNEGLTASIDTPKVWIAGDMHAQNVIVRDGKLAAIIDWGDMCAGDPATDLASAWALFESADARRNFISHYGASDATLKRARGWAVFFGAILLETGLQDSPRHAAQGANILRRLGEDAFSIKAA